MNLNSGVDRLSFYSIPVVKEVTLFARHPDSKKTPAIDYMQRHTKNA